MKPSDKSKRQEHQQKRVAPLATPTDLKTVGNAVFDAVLSLLKARARAPVCGLLERRLPVHEPLADPIAHGTGDGIPLIYVIDDDAGVRETLRDELEAQGGMVVEFDNAESFLASNRLDSCPDAGACLLVDACLPVMADIDFLEALCVAGDALPTIVFNGKNHVGTAVAAMRAGASDFIEKPLVCAVLLASIYRALRQSRDVALSKHQHEAAVHQIKGLTTRQRQVMDLVLAGRPNKIIATDLGISQRTVENHRAAVMRKTACKSLPDLTRLAVAVEGVSHPGHGETGVPA